MPVRVGSLFRHYRVIAKVGEGGMGVVYRARDTKLQRDVALKFIVHAPFLGPEHSDRLRREARALAALNHPNILTIHDIGDLEGMPFLVLEWVGGGTLSTAFPPPLSEQGFLRVALPMAEALGAAHDRGIVHRDVKPANVLVSDEARIKLADFGLAKFRDVEKDATRTAGTVGTLAYMSPEHAQGGELGPASDVFSFGVLAYEMLTGERPFKGEAPGAVIAAVMLGHYTPLSHLRRELPGGLVAVIDRCLKNEPAERFRDGNALAHALGRAKRGVRVPTVARRADSGRSTRTETPMSHAQKIGYCTTSDGLSLAYSTVGAGPFLVRVLGHFTHLEKEWEWPDLRRLWEQLAERHTLVRYDGRGIGLSDRYTGDFTEETRQLDLDAVLNAVGADKATLLGISEGGWTAAKYAVEHPERVAHLVLYGAYCRGAQARPGYDPQEDEALMTIIRKGWGRDTPAIRQILTSQFFRSGADTGLIAHFNELQRVSADPDTAARYHEACHKRGDGGDLFRQVRSPTLVVHGQDDLNVDADEGRLLASTIPGAQLVLLPTGAHYFPTDAEVVTKVVEAISRFLHEPGG